MLVLLVVPGTYFERGNFDHLVFRPTSNDFKPPPAVSSENASKSCQADGQWYFHEGHNRTWTNYSQCSGWGDTAAVADEEADFVEVYAYLKKCFSKTMSRFRLKTILRSNNDLCILSLTSSLVTHASVCIVHFHLVPSLSVSGV